jgi:RimJ/RimL family protein N-acetyltransferase
MAFGPIMQLKVGDLTIELAPITKESLVEFVSPGFQQASVTRYLDRHNAPTVEDEVEWYDKARATKDSLVWGIWNIDGKNRQLIGNTALTEFENDCLAQATSGSVISNKAFWGKGIASAIHKARTWYAFQHMGLIRIKSAVVHGNIASRKALEKAGYNLVYVERNTTFVDGERRHQDNLECLNPSEEAWRLWWGADRPSPSAREARARTVEVLQWAAENVDLL